MALGELSIEGLRALVRDVPDFPKPGIMFKDITPLIGSADGLASCVARLAALTPAGVEAVVAIESRGFLFGAPLALRLGLPVIPVRKPGKLPYHKRRIEYALEYGTDALEMHADALAHPRKVIIVDDVLATGGTAAATARLCRDAGGEVAAFAFVIELGFLGGRPKLGTTPVVSVLTY